MTEFVGLNLSIGFLMIDCFEHTDVMHQRNMITIEIICMYTDVMTVY